MTRIEQGDIEPAQMDTLRNYIEAIGGKLHIEVEFGDERFRLA
ncbi:hypothetical protein [Cryobacterium tepidiphilum]|nr:hypothetical protein [Cryobacterium tepidiphilum]